jgi:hypothetical protein
LKWDLQELIVSEDGIVLPGAYEADLDGTGDFSITLPTPTSGSALYHYTYPNGLAYAVELETGPSVDIATIQTIEDADVAQDALQDLMDQAEQFEDTTVTSWPYTLMDADRYIRASGTGNFNLLAAAQRKVPRIVFNFGTGIITALPAGSDSINGQASWPIYPGQAWLFIDNVAGRWDAW